MFIISSAQRWVWHLITSADLKWKPRALYLHFSPWVTWTLQPVCWQQLVCVWPTAGRYINFSAFTLIDNHRNHGNENLVSWALGATANNYWLPLLCRAHSAVDGSAGRGMTELKIIQIQSPEIDTSRREMWCLQAVCRMSERESQSNRKFIK